MVTILMSCYNESKYLSRSLESIISQNYTDWQLFAADDGSTDSTLLILKKYEDLDERIKIFSKKNTGMGDTLNMLIPFVKTKYIARMDADDIMYPDRLANQFEFLERNTDVDVLSCLANYIDGQDNIIGRTFTELSGVDDCFERYSKGKVIGLLHPGVMLRTERFLNLPFYYRGEYWPCEDVDLWTRMVGLGYRIMVMPKILMGYRIHGGSVIASRYMESRTTYMWVKYNFRRRKQGLVEVSKDEFVDFLNSRRFHKKFRDYRKNIHGYYYRLAGFKLASNKLLLFIAYFGLSFVIRPVFTVNKMIKQWNLKR